MDKQLKEIMKRIKNYLIETYDEKITRVIIYGSKARGEATKDSDVDVLVVVEDTVNCSIVRKSLSDLLWEILMTEGELVSVIVIPESLYNNYNSAFLINVREEGIIV
ncbi:MAG: nucleotidyltransferase domain-containing protein [Candidatus Heimdallarchaeota archaeon]|nr:nucleotidyltransferase domain-containing protein [Candidatus Heimdallarchaeota archaeon]